MRSWTGRRRRQLASVWAWCSTRRWWASPSRIRRSSASRWQRSASRPAARSCTSVTACATTWPALLRRASGRSISTRTGTAPHRPATRTSPASLRWSSWSARTSRVGGIPTPTIDFGAMRWSKMHIPTLRDDPADAGAPSHRLLLRAGYIRQLMAGHYSLLPLAVRVRAKVIGIIRQEMDQIGAQEVLLPTMHPAEIWQRSGRWEVMGEEMFRLKDRKGADLALGVTHEEIFAVLAQELSSHKELPQAWYQFQTKLRDEPRPRAGLLRVREFTMKDSYTFDLDAAG